MKQFPQRTLIFLVIILLIISVFSLSITLFYKPIVSSAPSATTGKISVFVGPQEPYFAEGKIMVNVIPSEAVGWIG